MSEMPRIPGPEDFEDWLREGITAEEGLRRLDRAASEMTAWVFKDPEARALLAAQAFIESTMLLADEVEAERGSVPAALDEAVQGSAALIFDDLTEPRRSTLERPNSMTTRHSALRFLFIPRDKLDWIIISVISVFLLIAVVSSVLALAFPHLGS